MRGRCDCYPNRIYRLRFLRGLIEGLFFTLGARPDVKSSMLTNGNLPSAPNSLPFPVTLVKDLVRTYVAFSPVALARLNRVLAFDQESTDIIVPFTAHRSVRKGEA